MKTLSDKIDGYDPITQIVVRGDVKQEICDLILYFDNESMYKGKKIIEVIKKKFGDKLI